MSNFFRYFKIYIFLQFEKNLASADERLLKSSTFATGPNGDCKIWGLTCQKDTPSNMQKLI